MIANQTVLSKIPNRYRKICQVMGQNSGQPTSWNGVFRGRSEKFRLKWDRVSRLSIDKNQDLIQRPKKVKVFNSLAG
jgi:hypothetical protein